MVISELIQNQFKLTEAGNTTGPKGPRAPQGELSEETERPLTPAGVSPQGCSQQHEEGKSVTWRRWRQPRGV